MNPEIALVFTNQYPASLINSIKVHNKYFKSQILEILKK